MTETKPTHEHDCDDCVFLGQYQGNELLYDLYFHKYEPGKALGDWTVDWTVIARYGSEGWEHGKWPSAVFPCPELMEKLPQLAEACRLAVVAGLIDEAEIGEKTND